MLPITGGRRRLIGPGARRPGSAVLPGLQPRYIAEASVVQPLGGVWSDDDRQPVVQPGFGDPVPVVAVHVGQHQPAYLLSAHKTS